MEQVKTDPKDMLRFKKQKDSNPTGMFKCPLIYRNFLLEGTLEIISNILLQIIRM